MGPADEMVPGLKKYDLENKTTFHSGEMTVEEFRSQAYQEIKKEMIDVKPTFIESKDIVDLQIDSDNPDLLSPISLEDHQIVPPDMMVNPIQQWFLEYPTPSESLEYSTKLDVDSGQKTFSEDLIVKNEDEHQLNVELPGYPFVVFNSENGLSLSSLSLSKSQLIAPESAIVSQEEDPLNPPSTSRATYVCTTTTCSLQFTSKLELFYHNMANHIGKYFSSVQPSDMPNDQFHYYINNVLETTVDTFDKADGKISCHLCSSQFPGREKARNHLVVKHRQVLKETLVELHKSESDSPRTSQQGESSTRVTHDTTSSKLKRKRRWPEGESPDLKSNSQKSKYHCADCSLYFRLKWRLIQHDLYNHPEKNFVSEKFEFLTPHQFQNCVAHMLSTTVDESRKVDAKYQCNFCSELIVSKIYMRKHIVLKHQSTLKEKLNELQKSSGINLIMNTSRRTNKIASLKGRDNKSSKYFCHICEREFAGVSTFNHHQSYFHPEIFFENSNFLPLSENSDQFKTIVKFILENEMAQVLRKRDKIKCRICSHVSSNRYSATYHLISRHRVFLAERLEDLQKSGNVPKSDSNTGGLPLKRMKTSYDPDLVGKLEMMPSKADSQ